MIRVSADIKRATASLDAFARKQLPFATALALTSVAKSAQAQVTKDLPKIFDRPTPFTMRAIAVQPATKASQQSRVFVKDAQASYLAIEETGGTRSPAGSALVIPVDAKLNGYGNLSKGQIAALLARPDVFSGVVKGIAGIWQRPARGVRNDGTYGVKNARGSKGRFTAPRLLIAYAKTAKYKPRFDFRKRVSVVVKNEIGQALIEALAKAMASKR